MDDVGSEKLKVAANPAREGNRQPIFGAAWNRDRRNADEVARRRESGMVGGRRIDPHLDALPQQIADEAIERLVGAVAHVIVIAREQGHAQVVWSHGQRL